MNMMEFNRRLENANADPQIKYLLGYLFEVAQEHDRNIRETVVALTGITAVLERYTQMNDSLLDDVKRLQRYGKTDGVEVHSVRRDPDDD